MNKIDTGRLVAVSLTLVLCFTLFIISASPAFAVRSLNCAIDNCNGLISYYPFSDFQYDDDFSGAAINTSRWQSWASAGTGVSFNGSVATLTGSAFSGGGGSGFNAQGKWVLVGDFDIQVDYSKMVKPSSQTDGGFQMMVYTTDGADGFYIRRQPGWQRYDSSVRINYVWDAAPGYTYVSSTDTSGKFRITRTGTTLAAYYWSGSSWTLLRTATNAAFAKNMFPSIEDYFSNPGGSFSVDYDNFKVNTGEVVWDQSGSGPVFDDNFTTTTLDTAKWTGGWNLWAVNGSELLLNVTSTSGWTSSGVNSRYYLRGNFDIQVDFNDLTYTNANDACVSFTLVTTGDQDYIWFRRNFIESTGYQAYYAINGQSGSSVGSNVATTARSGKLRYTRVGSTITTYYWNGASWTQQGSVTNNVLGQDIYVRMELGGTTPTETKKGHFDNFKVNSGQVVGIPGPTGVVTNATWASSPLGPALAFDGNDALANLGSQFTYQNFSISMWVKPNTTQNAWATLVDNNHNGGPVYNWASQQLDTATNNYYFFTFGTDDSVCYTFYNLTPDVWQQVSLVRQTGSIKAYVNGVLASSSTANCNVPVKYVTPSLTLGRHAGIPVRTWKGSMDDVSFWSRPLTLSEIRTMNELGPLNLPNVTTFVTGTTNFSAVADIENVPNATLVTAATAVRWTGLVNASGRNFDQYVNMGPGFVSLDVAALGQSINTTAVVNLSGINCENFDLYYATGVYYSLASLKSSGTLVATQQNTGGNCQDATKCTNVRCSNGVLSFTAQHFDGFGGDNGTDQNVPEFGTIALMMALGLTIGGFVAIRKKN